MKVIVDNNLWISFLIGKKLALLSRLFANTEIDVYVCDELLDEFRDVSHRDKIQKYISETDIVQTYEMMESMCTFVTIECTASSPIRDAKDLYLLSLAEQVKADYIVTGDKDLLELKSHGNTKIVTFAIFMAIL